MKDRGIIIVGATGSAGSEIARLLKDHAEILVVNNIEAKNIVNSAFEPEPFILTNHHKEWIEPKLYNDIPRNKFIDKPRHNFRRR